VPTGQRLLEVLLPEVQPALQSGAQQSVAAALISAAEALGVAEDMRMQLLARLPQENAPNLRTLQGGVGGGAFGELDSPAIAGAGVGTAGWGPGRHRFDPYGAPGVAAQSSAGPFEGIVKRIADKSQNPSGHAYGFVECEDTNRIYGRDVFLHDKQASELSVGARVRFEVALNARGMPQAHNLEVIG